MQLAANSKQNCLLETVVLPTKKGGYFLRHSLYLFIAEAMKKPHPLDGVVLYVVRTFLSKLKVWIDRAVCSTAANLCPIGMEKKLIREFIIG